MVALFGGGSFGLGRCGGAAHLLDDLVQADGQTRDGGQHRAQDLGVQRILVLELRDLRDLSVTEDLALEERALYTQ